MIEILVSDAGEFDIELVKNLKSHLTERLSGDIEYMVSGKNSEGITRVRVPYHPEINEEGFNLTSITGRIMGDASYSFELIRNGKGILVEYNSDSNLIRNIVDFLNQKNL